MKPTQWGRGLLSTQKIASQALSTSFWRLLIAEITKTCCQCLPYVWVIAEFPAQAGNNTSFFWTSASHNGTILVVLSGSYWIAPRSFYLPLRVMHQSVCWCYSSSWFLAHCLPLNSQASSSSCRLRFLRLLAHLEAWAVLPCRCENLFLARLHDHLSIPHFYPHIFKCDLNTIFYCCSFFNI